MNAQSANQVDPSKGKQDRIDFSMTQETVPYRPQHAVRFVTASSLFDGHDASINIMRRILQASGVEVIHLGHNRSVDEIVSAAIEEDVQGIAVSSYQGGHVEFFKYMYDLIRERGADHIRIFAGGGGVIVPEEIKDLESYGIAKIFSPDDGRRLGLQGMINYMIRVCDFDPVADSDVRAAVQHLSKRSPQTVAKLVTYVEQANHRAQDAYKDVLAAIHERRQAVPVLGITGTGGAGKSSLTDELVRRFTRDFADKHVAIFSIDPSKQKTGGALLGDRIRMNAIHSDRVFMRSLATRKSRSELSDAIAEAIDIAKAAAFDLIIVETSGIGQGDAQIVSISDVALYVMTAEFGAPSQLEKIDMLDYADLVVINKFDRRGSEDALRHVRKQVQRNQGRFHTSVEQMPVYGTVASQFNDPGTNVMYLALLDIINEKCGTNWVSSTAVGDLGNRKPAIIPGERAQYLLDIANAVKAYHAFVHQQVSIARQSYQLKGTIAQLREQPDADAHAIADTLELMFQRRWETAHRDTKRIVDGWSALQQAYAADEYTTNVRGKEVRTTLTHTSLSGTRIPKIALPKYEEWGKLSSGRCSRTSQDSSRLRRACFRSSAKRRSRGGSLQVKGHPSAPTGDFTI
ncbi:hypothetical protein GCM10025859_40010 [Alicyclobacillus fastidiosus]|nr:hypothetical protein GCM10025859_40010 [Alicyclobacillus fastidiosus]